MNDSSRVTLGQLARSGVLYLSDGYRTRRSEHGQPGFRIIRVADVLDGRVVLESPDFVSQKFHQQVGAKSGQPGDILLTTKGTIGRVAIMPMIDHAVVYSPQLCFFRVIDATVIHPGFLRYWFASPSFRRQASDRMHKTDMAAYINLADIRSLELQLPPVARQQGVAEILEALDEKIAANGALVAAADELSRLTFSSMLTEADRAPLSAVARFVNGKPFTKSASGTGRVVIRIAELNSGLGASTVYNDIEVADEHIARPGDILFAWSGSLTLHRWYREEAIINQHIFKVIPKAGFPNWCVNGLLVRRLEAFRAIAADKATTMGHIQRHHLDEPIEIPTPSVIERHDAQMSSLWQRALAAEVESLKLIAMRDAILPALVSGALEIRDAERIAGEVA